MASANSSALTELQLTAIRTDGGTQARQVLRSERVDEYAQALCDGAVFPPIVVFYDGSTHWLADGFHRLGAAKASDRTAVTAEIRTGTQRDARLYASGANATHGEPRTHADKRKAVLTLLEDAEWSQWSNREIARHCKVSHPFVAQLRRELEGGNVTTSIQLVQLFACDEIKDAPLLAKLPELDDRTWWWGFDDRDDPQSGPVQVAPSQHAGFWHVAVVDRATDTWTTTKKPVTKLGVLGTLLSQGFDVRESFWASDTRRGGACDQLDLFGSEGEVR